MWMRQVHDSWLGFQAIARQFDGVPPLLLRLYLAPVLLQAGWQKYMYFEDTVAWFGADGLNLPWPWLLAMLATATELVGGALLLVGLATRLVAIPLAITMAVAIVTVHAEHGWLAVADSHSWLADGTLFYSESIQQAAEKLERAQSILQTHGNYDWLTASGNLVILNNGAEFAATYLLMLLMLVVSGGGRYTSLDDWGYRVWRRYGITNT